MAAVNSPYYGENTWHQQSMGSQAVLRFWIWLWRYFQALSMSKWWKSRIKVLPWRLVESLQSLSGSTMQWLSLLHNFIQQILNLGAGSSPVCGVSEIRDGEDLRQWSRLETRLNAFRCSTIPRKQLIIIIIIWGPLTRWLLKGVLKQCLSCIQVTTFFGVNNFENT